MYKYQRSKAVDASPQQCFDFLTDPSKMPEWDANVLSSKITSPGPMNVGSKLEQVRKQGGREMVCTAEVIEHQPYSKHSVQSSILGTTAVFAYTFAPKGEGTVISVEATFTGKGILKLFEGMVGKMCEKVDDNILENIAQAMSDASLIRA